MPKYWKQFSQKSAKLLAPFQFQTRSILVRISKKKKKRKGKKTVKRDFAIVGEQCENASTGSNPI